MKFPFKSKTEINQSLNIVVPSSDIETQVLSKLKVAQKDAKLKGFRKGKAPMDVVTSVYGPEIRQDVIWDLATKSFSKLAEEKKLKIVSRPNLLPEVLEEGKDAKFKATFEVYPEVSLTKLSKLSFTNFQCNISDEDLDKTINNLQKRMSKWEPTDEVSKDGDQIKINFVGTIDEEEFEGGSANDFLVELGSKSMIEGFESGLIGLKKGDKKILNLTFPEDYGKKELASKPVKFDTEVRNWLEKQSSVSNIPKRDNLLIEIFKRGNRYYLVAYCFEGRKAHQTLGTLITKRMERFKLNPMGFVANDYAIAIWSKKCPKKIYELFSLDILGDDLEEWLEETSILKRSFRIISTIAGLINQNLIGNDVSKKQMTVNSDLIYDVLKRHQPDHFLLKATRQDAAKGLTDIGRLGELLKNINKKIEVRYLNKASPLSIPILLEIGKESIHGEAEEELLEELEEELSVLKN